MSLSMDALLDCMKSPVKAQVLRQLQIAGPSTTQQLLLHIDGIAAATLYRTMAYLTKDEVIEVVLETPIRGTVERTYALSGQYRQLTADLVESNDGKAYVAMLTSFLWSLLSEYETYVKQPDINLAEDGSGFSAVPIFATPAELGEMGARINGIIAPALTRQSPDQQLRTFATIITPPRPD
ncbi:MAG: hypothetical protein LBE83_09410 [Propionibacteriaceae bacterium]|jgi:DNA-binding HxlR family transcriptional regulator|nr:hypothetical protein [Propionibacteriaceae bacterium]